MDRHANSRQRRPDKVYPYNTTLWHRLDQPWPYSLTWIGISHNATTHQRHGVQHRRLPREGARAELLAPQRPRAGPGALPAQLTPFGARATTPRGLVQDLLKLSELKFP